MTLKEQSAEEIAEKIVEKTFNEFTFDNGTDEEEFMGDLEKSITKAIEKERASYNALAESVEKMMILSRDKHLYVCAFSLSGTCDCGVLKNFNEAESVVNDILKGDL